MFIPLFSGTEQLPALKKNHHLQSKPVLRESDAPVLLELVFPNGTVLKVRSQMDVPCCKSCFIYTIERMIHNNTSRYSPREEWNGH
jgi:hypothetical protein